MKEIKNKKGFKVLKLSTEECRCLGWGIPEGMICARCNDIIKGDVYYIAALNDVMDKDCYESFTEDSTYYEADAPIEQRNFDYVVNSLC
jgi:hypothetical protein